MTEKFFEGMQFQNYKYSTPCREDFSLLMNDFYFMYKNHTLNVETDDILKWEGRIMNITGVFAKPFAKTFLSCYKFIY